MGPAGGAGLLQAQLRLARLRGQKLEDVIAGLEEAWGFLDRIPKYLVVDNFTAEVAGPTPCIHA